MVPEVEQSRGRCIRASNMVRGSGIYLRCALWREPWANRRRDDVPGLGGEFHRHASVFGHRADRPEPVRVERMPRVVTVPPLFVLVMRMLGQAAPGSQPAGRT